MYDSIRRGLYFGFLWMSGYLHQKKLSKLFNLQELCFYEKKIFCFKRRRYVLFCLCLCFCFDIFFTKMCQCFFSAFVFMNCAKLQREKGVSVSQIGKWKWDAVSLDWTVRRLWIVENHNKIMGYYFLKLNDSLGWLVENY